MKKRRLVVILEVDSNLTRAEFNAMTLRLIPKQEDRWDVVYIATALEGDLSTTNIVLNDRPEW